jgi:hypothetical protein
MCPHWPPCSLADNPDHAAVLVRAADAERIGFPPQTVRLLAYSSRPRA